MNASLLSSVDMTWRTPACVLSRVRKVGPIMLDPCSGEGSLVQARYQYTEAEDGLAQPWKLGGLVYMNPPYGRAIKDWMAKCAVEHLESGIEAVALVPARVDTGWWHETVVGIAAAIGFWRGRITFEGAPAGAPFPSALVYYGNRIDDFEAAFGDACWIVKEK